MAKTRGVLLVLLAAFCFGTMPVFAHGAFAEDVDVPTLLFQRFGIATVLLWTLILIRRERLPDAKAILLMFAMGAIVYFGQALTLFEALKFLPAGLASVIAFVYPVFVSIASHFYLDEKLNARKAGALVLAVAGMTLSAGTVSSGSLVGIGLALLSAVGTAVYILIGSKLPKDVSPLVTNGVVLGGAAISFLVFGLAQGLNPTDVTEVEWAIALSFASLIGVGALLVGLKEIGPVNASILLALEPITAAVLGHTVLHQELGVVQLLGGGLIIVAVVMLISSGSRKKPLPSEAKATI